MLKLHAKSLKATVVLDPAALVGLTIPPGQPKVPLRIAVAGRMVSADLNAKSLRRCIATIDAAGPDGVAVIVQGKLEGDILVEAGIVAQPRVVKVQPAEAAAAE